MPEVEVVPWPAFLRPMHRVINVVALRVADGSGESLQAHIPKRVRRTVATASAAPVTSTCAAAGRPKR